MPSGYRGIRNFNTSPSTRGFNLDLTTTGRLWNFNTSPSTRGFQRHPQGRRRHHHFNTSPSTRGFEDVQDGMIEAIFQYQPLHEGLLFLGQLEIWIMHFNTSPSTRGFNVSQKCTFLILFQYQPLHEGLPTVRAVVSAT